MLTIVKPPGAAPEIEAGLLVLEPVCWSLGGRSFLLTRGRHSLGSAEDCTICLPHEGVEPEHCLIDVRPHCSVLEAYNLQTWHNDSPVRQADLRAGDRLRVGPFEFRVRTAVEADLLRLKSLEEIQIQTPPNRTAETHVSWNDGIDVRAVRRALVPSQTKFPKPRITIRTSRAFVSQKHEQELIQTLGHLQNDLQTLQNHAAELRSEVGELEKSKQKKTSEFEAIEQLLADETRKIREELAREQSSLAMESTLLREQRQRMEIRERALNAQRRELEDTERHLAQNQSAQEASRAKLHQTRKKTKAKLARLNSLESELQFREADCEAREKLLKAQQTEFEFLRQEFLDHKDAARDAIKAREFKCASLESDLQKRHEELARKSAEPSATALAEIDEQRDFLAKKERGLFKMCESLMAESAMLETTQAAIIEMQVRLEAERKQLAKDRQTFAMHQEGLRAKEAGLTRQLVKLESYGHELEEWEEELRLAEIHFEQQQDRDWPEQEHAAPMHGLAERERPHSIEKLTEQLSELEAHYSPPPGPEGSSLEMIDALADPDESEPAQ